VLGSREEPDALGRAQPAAGAAGQGHQEEEGQEEDGGSDGSVGDDDGGYPEEEEEEDDGSDEEGYVDDTEAQQRAINFERWYQEKLKPKLVYMEMMGHLP
jgi:hypothetical protein